MTNDQLFVLAILGLFVTPVFTLITSYIQRKRDLADRKEVAKQALIAAENNRVKLAEVHQAVDAVGQSAKEAYTEANHANLKIQAVLDANNIKFDKPLVPVTAEALREAKEPADG